MIRRATAGTREADNTISSALNSLFNPMTRKRVKELGLTEDQEGRYVSRLSQEIDAIGKESSIATGCIRIASGKLGGSYRQFMTSPVLETEFAPYLNRIISPPLRPVNSQIVRPEERTLLTRLISIMASLELRFMQERAEDGQLTYRLDPPIDVFVNYDGKRAVDIAVTRYAVRHLVAGEVEAKLTGQRVDIVEKSKPSFRSFFGSSDRSNAPSRTRPGDHADGPPSKRIKVDLADKLPTDFFGRPIDLTKLTVANQAHQKRHAAKCFKISYRFAEGNSAAVRRPVKLDSFL
ncbi:P-loop containing nucleoside triphosphate hydrolase protein [Salix suchowensis]|nr:P-loop containing nucleoside triphosphate hydrolase protein [Salix suchowensis]